MTETSGSLPEPTQDPGDPSRTAQTILGRLSDAIRQQNWFAVGLEVLIVIIGVVVGFQVTAWGESRADRVQEQILLRQLSADLSETIQLAENRIGSNIDGDRAITSLLQASYAEQVAPRDSVLIWMRRATTLAEAVAVLGTAEALISTGDLILIQDDSLRSAITAYVETSRRNQDEQAELRTLWFESHERMRRNPIIDFPDIVYATTSAARRDSIGQVLFSSIGNGPRVASAAMDAETLLRDRTLTAEVYTQLLAREFFRNNTRTIRRNAEVLLEKVRQEIKE